MRMRQQRERPPLRPETPAQAGVHGDVFASVAEGIWIPWMPVCTGIAGYCFAPFELGGEQLPDPRKMLAANKQLVADHIGRRIHDAGVFGCSLLR